MDDLVTDPVRNPCLRCGACCAYYRCSFYWTECDPPTPGGVPEGLTEQLTPFRAAMRGTNAVPPRCVALLGDIGGAVGCSIYTHRSSICRVFVPSYFDGTPNPECDKARAAHGLAPLTPGDWGQDSGRPKPKRPPRAA